MLKTLHAQSETYKLIELVNGRFVVTHNGKTLWPAMATAKEAKQRFIDVVPMSETIQWFTNI